MATSQTDILEQMTREERTWVLCRSYPLFAAYYFDLVMADYMAKMVKFSDEHQRACILVPAGHTKALCPSTRIPTPTGWTHLGLLEVGDEVFDENGEVCHVTKVLPWENRKRYSVTDRDGTVIIADEHHDWKVRLNDWQKPRIVETKDMKCNRDRRVRIANCKPLQLPEAELPMHPYVLGIWLGDGTSSCANITTADEEVVENIRATGMTVRYRGNNGSLANTYALGEGDYKRTGPHSTLRKLGVLNNKHVPAAYMRASESQRLALLQGLMDSDGNVMKDGQCWFVSTLWVLADAVQELVRSLGKRATMTVARAMVYEKDCGPCYKVSFYMKDCCLLPRKRERTRDAKKYYDHYVKVEELDEGPTTCISVDSPTQMFLAGENFTPTHNSATFGNYNIIRHICWNPNVRIQLVMSVFDDAEEYCKAIENELTGNQKLIDDFGEFYNAKDWTGAKFTVKQRQHNDPHATLTVYGAGGKAPNWSLKGKGCDLAVMDDVVTEDTSASPESRRRQKSWAKMTVFKNPRPMWPIHPKYGLQVPKGIVWPKDLPYNPRPGAKIPYGQIIAPGTRFHPYDLYQDLTDDPLWDTMLLDCWTDEEETKPLWPGFWTNEALHAERESGLIYFNKRMRNRPMDESEMTFHREWFEGDEEYPGCLNHSRSFGELPKGEDGKELSLFKALGFDPASGLATRFAAFPTFDLLGFPSGGDTGTDTRYVIDIFRQQVGPEYLIDILLGPDGTNPGYQQSLHPGFYAKYKFDKAVIEDNGFANLLIGNARITLAKRRGVLIEPFTTGRNKIDPVTGVKSMAAIFRDGLVDIPYKTDRDKKLAKEFIDQFVYFSFDRNGRRKSLTDYVMAFWFAEHAIRKTSDPQQTSYRHSSSPFTVRNPYFAKQKSKYTATLVGGPHGR